MTLSPLHLVVNWLVFLSFIVKSAYTKIDMSWCFINATAMLSNDRWMRYISLREYHVKPCRPSVLINDDSNKTQTAAGQNLECNENNGHWTALSEVRHTPAT